MVVALTPWRALANNSAAYIDKRPSMDTFMNEWKSLHDSKSGEREFSQDMRPKT